MPRLSHTAVTPTPVVQFVLSEPLDLMNAIYFTHLAGTNDEVDAWPAQVRAQADPSLLAEIDFLYTFPTEQPGVMGFLGDSLWAHPEAWRSLDSLISHVAGLPPGLGQPPYATGLQGFMCQAAGGVCDDQRPGPTSDPRADFAAAVQAFGGDVQAALAIYDNPEEVRQRIIDVIRRFYHEHYQKDLPRRWGCLERSVAAHRAQPVTDVVELTRRLLHRPVACLEDVCLDRYDRYFFAPSLDMGPYASCARIGSVHGLFYPCEAEFMGAVPEAEEDARLARLHKALGDETRLRILRLLRQRPMYAQEIVERTGLHQSVVSRHLMFLRAVDLVRSSKRNNVKYFSLNPEAREMLNKTLDLFSAGSGAT